MLKLREAEFNEGPAGVANAVKSMWAKIADVVSFGFTRGGGPAADGSDASFSGRDLIALLATLGIDLGLFALTVINPPLSTPDRNTLTQAEILRTREAIATAMSTAEDDDSEVNLEWVRRHVVHHIGRYGRRAMLMSPGLYDVTSAANTASFMVIPNLGSIPTDAGSREERRALALNQVAGVLTDANLIRAVSDGELSIARHETTKKSRTRIDDQEVPNVGLLAKAHRSLEMAGWSAGASDDPEIFRVVDADGLLPLLKILDGKGEPAMAKPASGGDAGGRPPGIANA